MSAHGLADDVELDDRDLAIRQGPALAGHRVRRAVSRCRRRRRTTVTKPSGSNHVPPLDRAPPCNVQAQPPELLVSPGGICVAPPDPEPAMAPPVPAPPEPLMVPVRPPEADMPPVLP